MFSFQKESDNFAAWALNPPRTYNSCDITVVICIRAYEGNSWVIERLKILGNLYQPAPCFQIVDFGSEAKYAAAISEQCARQGFSYHHIDDPGTFSLGLARNQGALRASTDLLYFTDIDFVSCASHYGELAHYAEEHDFGIIRDIVLNIPAYHLTEKYSDEFMMLPPGDRTRYLNQLASLGAKRPKGDIMNFVAPYSNNFLCTRDFFMISGGYDPIFRGYGSEDFELMVRFACHTCSVQLPPELSNDCHSPLRDSFFKHRPYLGFRRLGEAVSFPAESSGFKTFHLWHPSIIDDAWHLHGDHSRDKLRLSTAKYLHSPTAFASVDHIAKPLKALCICKHPEHYGYFLPFRALGYELIDIQGDSEMEIRRAEQLISTRQVDAFMIFAPHMESHAPFYGLLEKAKRNEVELVIIEQGALPSTLSYQKDIFSNEHDFHDYNIYRQSTPSHTDLDAACKILDKIRARSSPEDLSFKDRPSHANASRSSTQGIRVFLPLQQVADSAFNKPMKRSQAYAVIESEITRVALRHPDITFVVMLHPLKSKTLFTGTPNIITCKNEESIEVLINNCDFTIAYNFDMGILSLIHGKPAIIIGHSAQNSQGAVHYAGSLHDALLSLVSGAFSPPEPTDIQLITAWLITRKYSFFKVENHNIMITHLNWKGISLPLGRTSALGYIQENSYINGRLGLGIGLDVTPSQKCWARVSSVWKLLFLKYLKYPCRRFVLSLSLHIPKKR